MQRMHGEQRCHERAAPHGAGQPAQYAEKQQHVGEVNGKVADMKRTSVDAEQRGIRDGDWVRLHSRSGETTLRAQLTDRVAPGVVYTTFHHPDTQANVITTDYSDWEIGRAHV